MKSKQTLLAIGIAFTSLIGILSATASTILLHNLKQAEEKYTGKAVEGVLSALTQTQEDFRVHIDEWASWDDTYTFIQDRNQKYINSNLYPAALSTLKLNLILYVRPSGEIVYGTGFDLKRQKYQPIPPKIRSDLVPSSALLHHTSTKSSLMGIIKLPEGLMLLGSQPILTSKDADFSR
jgi:sensor domain CHASE-containing protein